MQIHPQVYIGEVKATLDCGQSAIHKRQVDGPLPLGQLGLEGDEQAEKRFHGGPDRALCHYPAEHYQFWANAYPELESLLLHQRLVKISRLKV